ncbi:UNVERIFIED_CONTAM: hypothetical protein Scaly_1904600 [Sesamum calycinum]|uniref:Reverse transcriptase domain-containing protein n=1 Tax=Sesamum calycinum TaxID=2727403 RepID=A0AAW2NF18_9LAMI
MQLSCDHSPGKRSIKHALNKMHSLKSPGPDGVYMTISLKLDINKAYDRVERNFLERVLLDLLERGILEGDPFSPHLFMLYAETFNILIQQEERIGNIQGVVTYWGGPLVSHLLLANDTLIFCQAVQEAGLRIKAILNILEEASEFKMNMSKSAIVFSRNTPLLIRMKVVASLGVPVVDKHDKYFGLPSVVGQSKWPVFDSIKDQIWRKMQSWSANKLSEASHVVMVKSVLQAIPIYSTSCFKLPKTFPKEVKDLLAVFFWKKEVGKTIHCSFGLKYPKAWRISMVTDSLVHRLFRAHYFSGIMLVQAMGKGSISYEWRLILAAKPLLQANYCWSVGDGSSIKIGTTLWERLIVYSSTTIRKGGSQFVALIGLLLTQPARQLRVGAEKGPLGTLGAFSGGQRLSPKSPE